MYTISEVDSKDLWNSFLEEVKPHTFLHTWNWGVFQESLGYPITRLGIYKKGVLVGLTLVITIRARRGTFLFCPHGPVFIKPHTNEMPGELIACLIQLAKKEKAGFIRVSPFLSDTEEHRALFRTQGFWQAPIHMHPERAWMLDITKTEEILLKEMRKQTRHCIRNAEHLGVTVRRSIDPQDIDAFYTMYEATVLRQDFVPFSRDYLKKEFSIFAKDNQAAVFLGSFHGELVSGAIVVFANGSGFYHHGASNPAFAKLPASHLLQWEIIRDVKRQGCMWYNFWGIAPEHMPLHPWAGLSLFKKGFGGFSEEYLPAQDLMLSQKYWITYGIEKLRKWKRGL